jgi:hypothetical protein
VGPSGPGLPTLSVGYKAGTGLLVGSITVEVSNPSTTPQTWDNVEVKLGGVNLTLTATGGTVKTINGHHCVYPDTTTRSVAGGATNKVVVTAVGGSLLGKVSGVALDTAACRG